MKVQGPWPWKRMLAVGLSLFVIGNGLCTLILYLIGKWQLTAWTGHVAQSTPSAVNELFLGMAILTITLYLLRHHEP